MSNISTAYDALLARLVVLFTSGSGWLQIPNGMDVPSNSEGFLKKGYGLAVGSSTNTKRQLSCTLSTDRIFKVSIARESFLTDGDTSGYDTIQKTLMEDLFSVIRDFEKNITLNGGQIFAEYVSDTGVLPIEGDSFNFVYVSCDFKISLFDNLN